LSIIFLLLLIDFYKNILLIDLFLFENITYANNNIYHFYCQLQFKIILNKFFTIKTMPKSNAFGRIFI